MRGLLSLSLIIFTTLMFLASSCAPVTQAVPYPNSSVPTDISTFTVTPSQSEKDLIIEQIHELVDQYNAFLEKEKQTGNFVTFELPDGSEGFLLTNESLKRAQQEETEVRNKIAELNEAYYQLASQENSKGAYPNQQYAASREFRMAMGEYSGPTEEEWENGTYVSIYSADSGGYSKVAIGDLYLIVKENEIFSATAQAKYEEHLDSLPVPENIIQAIQRIEGKDSHVKVGYSSGFSDPSLPGLILNTYQTETRYYAFDDQTNQIIAIDPVEMPSGSEPISTEELEKIARDLVARASPEINLDVLTPDHGEKRAGNTANLFFRWIDTSKMLSNGNHPFIQIGLTGKGELLNYVNTIPLAK